MTRFTFQARQSGQILSYQLAALNFYLLATPAAMSLLHSGNLFIYMYYIHLRGTHVRATLITVCTIKIVPPFHYRKLWNKQFEIKKTKSVHNACLLDGYTVCNTHISRFLLYYSRFPHGNLKTLEKQLALRS